MLTSRGRVVYGLLTIDKHNDCTNEYLSDEFRQALAGKVLKQNESDIEKVRLIVFLILSQKPNKESCSSSVFKPELWLKVSIERIASGRREWGWKETKHIDVSRLLRLDSLRGWAHTPENLLKLNKFPFLVAGQWKSIFAPRVSEALFAFSYHRFATRCLVLGAWNKSTGPSRA